MGRAKDIIIKPIAAKDANRIIKQLHYSGKVVPNSQIHFGVFLDGKCGGAMQFGPSLDKRKMLGLVANTLWNEFMELNRMAFADWLPRNSESRAIGVAMRLLRKQYPHIKWVISFADACQCGDGTIYRASGFVLTQIKENDRLYSMPNGMVAHGINMTASNLSRAVTSNDWRGNETERAFVERVGAELIPGYQLRYIYFLDPSYRERLTVPEIPYSRINEMGIGMYKGIKRTATGGTSTPIDAGGSNPTRPLQDAKAV